MAENKEEYEKGQMNGINDELFNNEAKNKSPNSTIVYALFGLIILLIISGIIFLYFALRNQENTKDQEDTKETDYRKANADLVSAFFKDGYEYKNFDKVKTYMTDNYYDHSPAAARSNEDAVNILKSVGNFFSDVKVEMLDLTCEKDMVAARMIFYVTHSGDYNGIPATGKRISFEALENFKVVDGKIVESWGYWPDKGIEDQLKQNKTK